MNHRLGSRVRTRMLWAALVLASTSPLPAPLPLARDVRPFSEAAPDRTFHIDLGGAQVTVSIDVAAVARPVRVPVRVRAAPHLAAARGAEPQPLTVFVCDDARCALRTPVEVPLDDTPVTIEATLFPTGLALALRHGDDESMCCSTASSFGGGTHAIALTAPSGVTADVRWYDTPDVERGNRGGIVVTPAGHALRARPSMLHAFNAIIVSDDAEPGALGTGAVHDPLVAALEDYVKRGGIASVPLSAFNRHFAASARSTGRELSMNGSMFITSTGASSISMEVARELAVPPRTLLVPHGEGELVVRPAGATPDEMLAGLAVARPAIVAWQSDPAHRDSVAMRAAWAGLAAKPHRGVSFFVAFAAVVGIAWSMRVRSAARHGWRRALTRSLAIGASGALALGVFELVSMPRETHVRVVALLGPKASWEVGVDAKRPRSTGEVTVTSPIAPISAAVLGADTLPPRTPHHAVDVDVDVDVDVHGPVTRVSAEVGSASALAVSWERPVSRSQRGVSPVALVDGKVKNNLDVPLRAVVMARGNAATQHIAPGASRAVVDFASSTSTLIDDLRLSPMERRLLHEVSEACVARLALSGSLQQQEKRQQHPCGAAIAWLADGTLLGVEVAQ